MRKKLPIKQADFDRSVRPQDDFFQFVNGGWIKRTSIPAAESVWGSFSLVRKENIRRLHQLFEKLKRRRKLSAEERKVRDFFESGMDTRRIKQAGIKPIRPFMKKVEELQDAQDITALVAHLHQNGVGAFWTIDIDQDMKRSETMAIYIAQNGLGLPDRDYYLKDDKRHKAIRKKYTRHIAKIFQLYGAPKKESGERARAVMKIESALARGSMRQEDARDIDKIYNVVNKSELTRTAPQINWSAYFEEGGYPTQKRLILEQPDFIKKVSSLLRTEPLDNIKAYLEWCVLDHFAPYLDKRFEEAHFQFYGRVIAGTRKMRPRWERMVGATNGVLRDAVAKLYVNVYFPSDAKKKMDVLVTDVVRAYAERIENLRWMTPATRKAALKKLRMTKRKIGYPKKWRSYTSLTVDSKDFVENITAAARFHHARAVSKLGKPADRNEWAMSPATVNACYSFLTNDVTFPAGILQPPFFDPQAPQAFNYGAIGSIIGHELTHGFDDQGRKFDAKGNLHNWWSKQDHKRFEERGRKLVRQYNACRVRDGLRVNGKLTLGENIADLGGLAIAYDAYLRAVERSGSKATQLQRQRKFTDRQLFFIGYAVTERVVVRPEMERLKILVDPHAPSKFRVNVPLSNMKEFHAAFNVACGDAIYRAPGKRVKIW